MSSNADADANTDAGNASDDQSRSFMGGTSARRIMSTQNQNQYSDPGVIAQQQQQQQGQQYQNQNQQHNHNIVISAEDIKKELEQGDFNIHDKDNPDPNTNPSYH